MLDLRSDHRVHRILVPVPVLAASINHSAVGTFDYIPERAEGFTKMETSGVNCTVTPCDVPRPGVFRQAHPGRVRGSRGLWHHYDFLSPLVAGLE